jgi:hypothetical protein
MLSKALEVDVCFHRSPHLGNIEGRSFSRALKRRKIVFNVGNCYDEFDIYVKKKSCKRATIGTLLVNLEGVRSVGLLKKKKSWFFFLEPEDIKSYVWGGHLEL